jgi:hypothetical protein
MNTEYETGIYCRGDIEWKRGNQKLSLGKSRLSHTQAVKYV